MTAEHTIWFRDPRPSSTVSYQTPTSRICLTCRCTKNMIQIITTNITTSCLGIWHGGMWWVLLSSCLFSRLIDICRTSSLKILQHMGLCLCQSFLAVIRQLFLTPQDTQSIGRSISPLEIFITMLDACTRTVLFF